MAGRRSIGVLILAAALLVALVVPGVLRSGTAGMAVRAPIPEPLPVGTCLMGTDLVVVECGELHTSEVTRSWSILDPTTLLDPDPDSVCWEAAKSYIGLQTEIYGPIWYQPILNYTSDINYVSREGWPAKATWRYCSIEPATGSEYRGSVGGLAEVKDRPGAFGSCRSGRSSDVDFDVIVSCAAVHRAENLGFVMQFVPDDPTNSWLESPLPDEATLLVSCIELAISLLENPDHTRDGQLEVAIDYSSTATILYEVAGDGPPTEVPGNQTTATCYLQGSTGQWFTDSLVGLGDNPLPVR